MAHVYELKPQDRREARPHAAAAQFLPRHRRLAATFLILVGLPVLLTATYLFGFAQPRFVSYSGFSVRSDGVAQHDLLAGLSALSGGSQSDTAMVYDFLKSPEIVTELAKTVNLKAALTPPGFDPLFAGPLDSVESLVDRWQRMTRVAMDSRAGLVSFQVRAFSPQAAQDLNAAVLAIAAQMLAEVSRQIRTDTTALARQTLAGAQTRLRDLRQQMTALQTTTDMLDPKTDIEGQLGVLATLQSQLVEAEIARNLLLETSNPKDPRVFAAQRRVAVIRKLIADERAKFGESDQGLAAQAAAFEALQVDLEYAREAYLTARANLDMAEANAQRQARYLAVHIKPTLAQTAEFPKRWQTLVLVFAGLTLGWVILALGVYGVRGRL